MRNSFFCVALALTSCASVKPYPVCFYDANAPSPTVKSAHVEKLVTVLQKFDASAKVTQDGRWILATTTNHEHKDLTQVWPRLACVGKVTSGTEVKQEADCVDYLHEFLKEKTYLKFDIKENVPLSDEAPGSPNVICYREP